MNNDPTNDPMLDAVAGQPASRRGFRGCTGFAVHAVACVALLFAGPLPSAQAQTRKTWNVATGDWATAGSWNTSGAPSGATDVAVFEGTGLTLSASGTATPSIGLLQFNNTGTTTIAVNKITLNSNTGSTSNSGTGIYLGSNSGNVFISNTSTHGTSSRDGSIIVSTTQIWRNDSTSGTLSVQHGTGNIYLGTPRGRPANLILQGAGAIQLGEIRTQEAGSMLTYDGTGVLTLGGSRPGSPGDNGFGMTINSGTVINATTNNTIPFGNAAPTTINGGAIGQVGTGTASRYFLVNNSFSFVSGTLRLTHSTGTTTAGAFTVGSNPVTVTVDAGAELEIFNGSGMDFVGSQRVTKSGLGTMVMTRPNNDNFTGGFTVQQGLFVIQNDRGNAGSSPLGTGTFTIAGGTISSGTVQGASLTMPSRFDGSFSVAGFQTGTTSFNLGTGTVTLTTTPTIDVVDPAITFTIGGRIEGGSNGLTKSGPGRLTLTGSSTYTGLTTVSSGTLEFTTNGSVDGNIDNNAMLVFNRSAYTYGGVISGTGNLFKGQSVDLRLNNANTFSGTTSFASSNPGTITLGNASALQNSGIDTAGAGVITAASSQTSLTIGGLIGSRNFSSAFTTGLTTLNSLTLNPQAGRSFSYSGTIADRTSGTTALTKTGAGEQILSAVNTYTGLTTVSAGRLTIGGGNINASSGVTVNGTGAEFRYNSATAFNKTLTLTQGILSGTGTIQTAVTVGSNAMISPGNSPGSQTYGSSVWQAGGTYLWELNAQTGTPGTNWDMVVISSTGSLNLTGLSPSNKFNINLTTLTMTGGNTIGPLDVPWTDAGTTIFPFVSFATGSLSVPAGFSNAPDSDLTGLFYFDLTNWLVSPQPSSSDISVRVNSGGNGLDLVIVPEPATIALAGIGIGTAVWFFRRRRGTA